MQGYSLLPVLQGPTFTDDEISSLICIAKQLKRKYAFIAT